MKFIISTVLLLIIATSAICQTYRYEYESAENPSTGVKTRHSGSFYLTFTNGQNDFFQSDADGSPVAASNRKYEFGKTESSVDVIQYVMGYGILGPVMGTAMVNSQCNGIFSFAGYEKDMMKYRAYKYHTYRTVYGEVKTDNDIYLYVYISDDFSTLIVKNASRFRNNGEYFIAYRKQSSSQSPSTLW